MFHSLAYASRTMVPAHSVDIIDIARASMRNNRHLALTGALYFDDHQFFQVLEGTQDDVRAMFERIRVDPRHSDVALLHEGALVRRRFEHWSMKFVDGAWVTDGRVLFDYTSLREASAACLDARVDVLASLA